MPKFKLHYTLTEITRHSAVVIAADEEQAIAALAHSEMDDGMEDEYVATIKRGMSDIVVVPREIPNPRFRFELEVRVNQRYSSMRGDVTGNAAMMVVVNANTLKEAVDKGNQKLAASINFDQEEQGVYFLDMGLQVIPQMLHRVTDLSTGMPPLSEDDAIWNPEQIDYRF